MVISSLLGYLYIDPLLPYLILRSSSLTKPHKYNSAEQCSVEIQNTRFLYCKL